MLLENIMAIPMAVSSMIARIVDNSAMPRSFFERESRVIVGLQASLTAQILSARGGRAVVQPHRRNERVNRFQRRLRVANRRFHRESHLDGVNGCDGTGSAVEIERQRQRRAS